MGWEVTLVLLGPLSLCRNAAGNWVRASGAGSGRGAAAAPRRPGRDGQGSRAGLPPPAPEDIPGELVTSFCILIYGIVSRTTCGVCEEHCICMNRAVLEVGNT